MSGLPSKHIHYRVLGLSRQFYCLLHTVTVEFDEDKPYCIDCWRVGVCCTVISFALRPSVPNTQQFLFSSLNYDKDRKRKQTTFECGICTDQLRTLWSQLFKNISFYITSKIFVREWRGCKFVFFKFICVFYKIFWQYSCKTKKWDFQCLRVTLVLDAHYLDSRTRNGVLPRHF